MLFNFLVKFCIVYADVIRDDGYHNYEGQFTVVNKGRMLRVLMFFNNVQREMCALHCVRHLRCRSINYSYAKKECELTDENFNEMNVDIFTLGWHNYGTPPKVNGGWSRWRNLTECTKTCEGGKVEQWRDCDSPKPEHGGADCKGRMRRTAKCNTHGCQRHIQFVQNSLFGKTFVNFALKKEAKQSSTYNNHYPASKAVDGSTSTSCCTKKDTNQWWEIDLGQVRVIKDIHLKAYVKPDYYNLGLSAETRENKWDSWTECKNIGDVKITNYEFKCYEQSTKAQFLRITAKKRCYIYFREVEIFGYENN